MINRFTVAPLRTMKSTLAAVARGYEAPDCVITGARVLSTYSERVVEEREIWIKGGRIAAVKPTGSYPLLPGDRTVRYDVEGGIIAPGLVDALVDLPGSMMSACAYAETALLNGTTAIICHCQALIRVLGKRGLRWFVSDACRAPLSVFVSASCLVPNMGEGPDTAGDVARDLAGYPKVGAMSSHLGLPRTQNAHGDLPTVLVLAGKENYTTDVLSRRDFEISEDFLEADAWLSLRGGCRQNLITSLKAMTELGMSAKRVCFCTGERDVLEPFSPGLDRVVRQAIAAGVTPVTAWSMASLHPATRCGLDGEIGGFGHARRADLVLLNDDLEVQNTWYGGQLVVENGRITSILDRALSKRYEYPQVAYKTVRLSRRIVLTPRVPNTAVTANVVGVEATSASVFEHRRIKLHAEKNWAELLTRHRLCFLAIIERSRGTSETMYGLLQGFGLVDGAVASSGSLGAPAVVIAGTNEADMKLALTTVKQSGGGVCAVRDGRVLANIPLPIGGLISDQRASDLALLLKQVQRAWTELGFVLSIPRFNRLMNDMQPQIRVTERGLVLGPEMRVVPLFEPIIDATA